MATAIRKKFIGLTVEEQLSDHIANLKKQEIKTRLEQRKLDRKRQQSQKRVETYVRAGNEEAALSEAKKCAGLKKRHRKMAQLNANIDGITGNLESRRIEHKVMEETGQATVLMGRMGANYHPAKVQRAMQYYNKATGMMDMASDEFAEGLDDAHDVEDDSEDVSEILESAKNAVQLRNMEGFSSAPMHRVYNNSPPMANRQPAGHYQQQQQLQPQLVGEDDGDLMNRLDNLMNK
jgi:hypothetical protein